MKAHVTEPRVALTRLQAAASSRVPALGARPAAWQAWRAHKVPSKK